MSGHAPGPWTIHDERRVFGGTGLICECRVPLQNDPDDDEFDCPEVLAAEAEAASNARLIAASPRLLAAAKAILLHFIPEHLDSVSGTKCGSELRDAVAEAEGVAP